VQAEQVAAGPDATRGIGKPFISSALGSGGEDVGVLIVVAAVDPSGEHEQTLVNANIVAQVLGHMRRFVEGICHTNIFRLLFLSTKKPRSLDGPRQDKRFEIGRAEKLSGIRVFLQLVAPVMEVRTFPGKVAIGPCQFYIPPFTNQVYPEFPRRLR